MPAICFTLHRELSRNCGAAPDLDADIGRLTMGQAAVRPQAAGLRALKKAASCVSQSSR